MRDSRTAVHIDVVPGEAPSFPVPDDDEPFRVLVAGDFSGRANRKSTASLKGRRPLPVDRDNLDDVIAALSPQLNLPGIALRFGQLDDFHPDRIFPSGPFQSLLERLSAPPQPSPAATAAPPQPPPDLLEDILASEPDKVRRASAGDAGDLAAFIRRVTAPHLAPRPDSREEQRREAAERAAGALMSAILHHRDFQALEAAWRALDFLVRRLETGPELKLYLLDVTREELRQDADAFQALLASPASPWAVCAVNLSFGRTVPDIAVLESLGKAARSAGCPILAEADPSDVPASDPRWDRLRSSPEAHWLGLALPRFLLRLPYGRGTSPIESFPYEEMPVHAHQEYLWGSPAFACAFLLCRTFLADGWRMRPGTQRTLDHLPQHVYREDGDTCLKPCAEVLMKESDAELLMEQGIMPLASLKGQDAALLVRFQSIARPLRALAGRWSEASGG